MTLPADEQFTVEYVTNKSWSGYNWYQGDFRSLIQVNTDLPIYIDRAIDLACHEGYPGHHVYNALLEKHLVKDRGWVEFTVYPLFSPQSLIAEGTANFGIEVAFPGQGARRVRAGHRCFPLAGLDPARAAEYYEVQALVDQLSYAGNEAARRYLNGEIDAAQAAAWLERYALMPHDRAAAARAVLRPVPQLRDQLQPRQGHGPPLHRVARRHAGQAGEALGGVREAAVVAATAVRPQVFRGGACTTTRATRRSRRLDSSAATRALRAVSRGLRLRLRRRAAPATPIRSDGFSYYVYLPVLVPVSRHHACRPSRAIAAAATSPPSPRSSDGPARADG